MTIMASGTVSRMDCRWASRASASCVLAVGAQRDSLQLLAAPCHADADRRRRSAAFANYGSARCARPETGEEARASGRAPSPADPDPIRPDRRRSAPPAREQSRAPRPARWAATATRAMQARPPQRPAQARKRALADRGGPRPRAAAWRVIAQRMVGHARSRLRTEMGPPIAAPAASGKTLRGII